MSKQYLSREEASEYCKSRGLPVEKTTLQKYATVGGGPSYKRFGNRAVYTPDELDAWLENKLTDPASNTSCDRG